MTGVDRVTPPQQVAGQEPACWGVAPEVFFGPADSPDDGPVCGWERCALAVCTGCPVAAACLAEALEFPAAEQYGVVGGMTAGQRRAVLRASRRRPTRSSVAGAAALFEQLPRHMDGLAVAQLMAGAPLVGASRPEDLAHAALNLHRAAHQPGWIATRLGVSDRQVYRWLTRHSAGSPLTPPQDGLRTGTSA